MVRVLEYSRVAPHVPVVWTNPFVVAPIVDVSIPTGFPVPVWTGVRMDIPDDIFVTAIAIDDGPLVFGATFYGGELVVLCSAPLNKASYLHSAMVPLAKICFRGNEAEPFRFIDVSAENILDASANSTPIC